MDDLETERLAERRRLAAGYREAACRALRFARRYRREEGALGAREKACIDQAMRWRRAARDLALGLVRPGLASGRVGDALPGLSRATADGPPDTGGRKIA